MIESVWRSVNENSTIAQHAGAASPAVRPPSIIGHQGTNAEMTGNTMRAFRAAAAYVEIIETDVQFTRDQVMVIFHDKTLDESTTGSGPIAELTFRQLRRYRLKDGSRIPTFLELLRWIRKTSLTLVAEMKLDGWTLDQVKAYSRIVRRCGMANRVVASSFDFSNIEHLTRYDPGLTTAFVYSRETPSISALRTAGSISMPWIKNLTPDEVALQHAAGLQVWCWTARTATQYRSAIELGVDAVVADDPRSLRTWLASRSPSLPTH